jgi:hypothetical protein
VSDMGDALSFLLKKLWYVLFFASHKVGFDWCPDPELFPVRSVYFNTGKCLPFSASSGPECFYCGLIVFDSRIFCGGEDCFHSQ